MKIIEDNYNSIPVGTPLRIRCSECSSKLEIREEDLHVGEKGYRQFICPCCGEVSTVYELDPYPLTLDNLEFPMNFSHYAYRECLKDTEVLEQIRKNIKEMIQDEDDWGRVISYKNMRMFIFRYDNDEMFQVTVTKDYYETEIPFEGCGL